MEEFCWVKITGPDFTKVTRAWVNEHLLRTTFGTFYRDTLTWIVDPNVKIEILESEKAARDLLK